MTRIVYQGCQALNEKLSHRPNKIIVFIVEVILQLAEFSHFEEYITKDGKVQLTRS